MTDTHDYPGLQNFTFNNQVVYNLKTPEDIFKYFPNLPIYFNYLLQIVLPEQSIFVVNDNQNITVTPDEHADFLPTDFETGIYKCDEKLVTVLKSGSVKTDELKDVLPAGVDLVIQPATTDLSDFTRIDSTESLELQTAEVVLGTKEKLREVLGIELPAYFTETTVDGVNIINLGSQTNLESVARNLIHNIELARSYTNKTRTIIDQNWGNSYWGQYISTNLTTLENTQLNQSKVIVSDSKGENSGSILGGFISPVLA